MWLLLFAAPSSLAEIIYECGTISTHGDYASAQAAIKARAAPPGAFNTYQCQSTSCGPSYLLVACGSVSSPGANRYFYAPSKVEDLGNGVIRSTQDIAWYHDGCPSFTTDLGTICPSESNSARAKGPVACNVAPGTVQGDPIQVGTGNSYQVETDYTGAGNFPIVVKRHYNSEDGVWRFSYTRGLDVVPDLGVLDPRIVTAVRDTGREVPWGRDSSEDLITYSDNPLVLTEETSGGWTVTNEANEVESYNSEGHLQTITDLRGQTLTFAYDTSGRLTDVTDSAGRQVEYGYDGSTDRIDWMDDPADERTEYTYDSTGRLKTVTYPDASVREYHYWGETAEGGNTNFPNALTGISDEEDDRIVSWTYDSSGRATSSVRAGDVDETGIDYTGLPDEVTVTNTLGRDSVLTLTYENGLARVTDVDGAATSLCAASTSAIAYDSNGYVDSRTDENGVVTDYTTNDRGLVTTRVEASGTGDARTTTTTWHSEHRVPESITRAGQQVDPEYDSAGRVISRTVRSD
jgi:YD repeat-containing protein